ncbi:MAG: hypothetical protein ACE15C_05930 [Phycisphaerae bacterium]
MEPLADLHCHYLAQDPDALAGFKRLAKSPDIFLVAVCALDLKLPPGAAAWPRPRSTASSTTTAWPCWAKSVSSW